MPKRLRRWRQELIVAHSVGGAILLRYFGEEKAPPSITALFFVAVPYFGPGGWSPDSVDIAELIHRKNFVSQVTETVPLFFYHNRDDKIVPFAHLELYREQLRRATFRAFDRGGHQFKNGLSALVRDIKNLTTKDTLKEEREAVVRSNHPFLRLASSRRRWVISWCE